MIFEVGEEYWLTYGTTENQSFDSIKVLEVDGTWLKVEAVKVDSLINVAAPFFISAKKRDRKAEEELSSLHSKLENMSIEELVDLAKG